MNTMMIAPGGQSSLLIMHSAPHAITNDQTLHIIAHHLAGVLRWLGSPHTPTLAIKISVIEHINYTHPATAMITISHVWMDYSYLQQKMQRQSNDFGETGGRGGLFIILQRTADVGYVAAWMLTALAFRQCAVIACKWTWICILTYLH